MPVTEAIESVDGVEMPERYATRPVPDDGDEQLRPLDVPSGARQHLSSRTRRARAVHLPVRDRRSSPSPRRASRPGHRAAHPPIREHHPVETLHGRSARRPALSARSLLGDIVVFEEQHLRTRADNAMPMGAVGPVQFGTDRIDDQ